MTPLPSQAAPVRIVLVDDHKIMREGVRGVLEAVPAWRVVGEAADSESGWSVVESMHPDLLLLDLDIPGEGGIGLLRRVKAQFPAIKVVILSSSVSPNAIRTATELGAAGYVPKASGGDVLVGALHEVIGGGTALAETPAEADGDEAELTPRELQVLTHVVEGMRNKEIADRIGVSVKSVETYRARAMRKTGCESPAELVRYALRAGIGRL